MADQTVRVDSGSPERIAFELFERILVAEPLTGDRDARAKVVLDLYAECLTTTRGFRKIAPG